MRQKAKDFDFNVGELDAGAPLGEKRSEERRVKRDDFVMDSKLSGARNFTDDDGYEGRWLAAIAY